MSDKPSGKFFLRKQEMPFEADDGTLYIKIHDDDLPNAWLPISWYLIAEIQKDLAHPPTP